MTDCKNGKHSRSTDAEGCCVACGETIVIVDHVLLARLARVEEDLSAFKRAHAGHSHELRPFALHTLAPTRGTTAPTPEQMGYEVAAIDALRANAENRAWQCFEDWSELEIKKPENAGNVYEVRILMPDDGGKTWHANLWVLYTNKNGGECSGEIVGKAGTSRVDALAHLAAWCQAEMPL